MANTPSTLPELVDQLGRTFSPYERLKIVARAWSLLRQMSPDQRMIVAAQLGLDQADEIVKVIADKSGSKTSPVLMSMIERAQTKGLVHLPQLISDLKDPQRRLERLRQGAEAAGAALVEENPQAPWLPPGVTAAPPPKPTPPKPPPPVSRRPEPPPVPKPQAAPAPPPPAAPPKPAPAPPPPAPVAAPAAPPPSPAPAPPPPAPVTAAPAPPPAPEPSREPVRAPATGALAERLAAVPSLTTRFRMLRRSLGDAKRLSAADLRTLVEVFPDGWSRRRAILELLRAGVPGKLAEALPLVGSLSSERDRAWCLGELIESRDVPEGEREGVLSTIATPTARRRLERRMGAQ